MEVNQLGLYLTFIKPSVIYAINHAFVQSVLKYRGTARTVYLEQIYDLYNHKRHMSGRQSTQISVKR